MPLPKYGYSETKRNQELVFNMAPEFLSSGDQSGKAGDLPSATRNRKNSQRRAQVTTGKVRHKDTVVGLTHMTYLLNYY